MPRVSIELNNGTLEVVAVVSVGSQEQAERYKSRIENFIGVLTGELTTTVSGQAVVDAARSAGA